MLPARTAERPQRRADLAVTKHEFVLGKAGVTIAVIRRDDTGRCFVPVDGSPR
jgi:hypothetical protein